MTLTTLSKGWFRDFGHEHFPGVRKCNKNLIELVKTDGRLRDVDFSTDDYSGETTVAAMRGRASKAIADLVSSHIALLLFGPTSRTHSPLAGQNQPATGGTSSRIPYC